jgi:hypothetical protein
VSLEYLDSDRIGRNCSLPHESCYTAPATFGSDRPLERSSDSSDFAIYPSFLIQTSSPVGRHPLRPSRQFRQSKYPRQPCQCDRRNSLWLMSSLTPGAGSLSTMQANGGLKKLRLCIALHWHRKPSSIPLSRWVLKK